MSKICTSIDQSKKLIELGIDANTADLWWNVDDRDYPSLDYNIGFHKEHKDDIPAWSIAALNKILKKHLHSYELSYCSAVKNSTIALALKIYDTTHVINGNDEFEVVYEGVCLLLK